MKTETKSMNSNECLLSFPVVGKTLKQYFIVSSGRLLEVLKTTFWIAIAITVGLLVGQLHYRESILTVLTEMKKNEEYYNENIF